MAILSVLLTAVIIIVSVLLVLVVLVQRPKQEGLGAAFGGGAFDSALGAHTTDVLQKITTYLAVVFFASAILLSMVKARQFTKSPASNVLEQVDKHEPVIPGLPPGISGLTEDALSPSSAPESDESSDVDAADKGKGKAGKGEASPEAADVDPAGEGG